MEFAFDGLMIQVCVVCLLSLASSVTLAHIFSRI
jgi:hypothetical protein